MKRFVFSNIFQIFRTGLTSEQSSSAEVAYLSDAQDLAIDAVNAYMYWTTAQSLECARLNGLEYFQYTSKADFLDERIAGLTLDLDEGHVYWLELTSLDGAQVMKLYGADMAGYGYVLLLAVWFGLNQNIQILKVKVTISSCVVFFIMSRNRYTQK